MTAIWSAIVSVLVLAQMPQQMPAQGSYGWPMPAFKLAIMNYELGLEPRAALMGEELWQLRDPESGLWINWKGEPDTVNPMYAASLYEKLGQHDRALEVYKAQVKLARSYEPDAYNLFWWPVIVSRIVGEPIPLDLFARAAPGFAGVFGPPAEMEPNEHGRYYADAMMGHWYRVGGPRFPLYHSDWCEPQNQPAERREMYRKCRAYYAWAEGKPFVPVLNAPFGFMTDDVLFMAVWKP